MKTYKFNHFYEQNLVLLTMVPRNSKMARMAPFQAKVRIGYKTVGANEMTRAIHKTNDQVEKSPYAGGKGMLQGTARKKLLNTLT